MWSELIRASGQSLGVPAVVCGAPPQQEVDVHGQLLPLTVGPVLRLLHHRHLGRQLRKHHAAGCAEVQPRACTMASTI